MSSPAAQQLKLSIPARNDDKDHPGVPLQSPPPPDIALDPHSPLPTVSSPASRDLSQPPNPQNSIHDTTTLLDPGTQLNASLNPQEKQTASAVMDQQQHQVIKTEGIEPSLNGANTAIELVEHTPGTIAIEEAVGVTEDVGEWVQEGDQMKRVKVCLPFVCRLIPDPLTHPWISP